MTTLSEKDEQALNFFTSNALFQRVASTYTDLQERREALGLSNPGTVDNIAKEVERDVFLNQHAFSGLRADITKAFSVAPMFQVSHSLSMGSSNLNPYSFAAIYGSPKARVHGSSHLSLYTFGLIRNRSFVKLTLTTSSVSSDASIGDGVHQWSRNRAYSSLPGLLLATCSPLSKIILARTLQQASKA